MTFEFDKRVVSKQGELVTVNHGSDESTADVAHLRRSRSSDELHELSYEAVAKLYADERLTRKNLFSDRDKPVVSASGHGETPAWLPKISAVLPFEKEAFVYSLDHLQQNLFFAREIEDKEAYEYVMRLHRDNGMFELDTVALLYTPDPDSDIINDVSGEAGEMWINVDKGDANQQFEIDADLSLPDGFDDVHAAIREILTGVFMKHGYNDEVVEFGVQRFDSAVSLLFEGKNFRLNIDIGGDGLMVKPPVWVKLLLQSDGCPVEIDHHRLKEAGQ